MTSFTLPVEGNSGFFSGLVSNTVTPESYAVFCRSLFRCAQSWACKIVQKSEKPIKTSTEQTRTYDYSLTLRDWLFTHSLIQGPLLCMCSTGLCLVRSIINIIQGCHLALRKAKWVKFGTFWSLLAVKFMVWHFGTFLANNTPIQPAGAKMATSWRKYGPCTTWFTLR